MMKRCAVKSSLGQNLMDNLHAKVSANFWPGLMGLPDMKHAGEGGGQRDLP